MQLATIICVHTDPELARDTIDSVRAWVTRKILLIVDKAGWHHYQGFKHPDTEVMCGLYHKARKSPYKNMAVGLREAYGIWPDVDWYHWLEYDAVYLNDYFRYDLDRCRESACVGFDPVGKFASNDHWLVKEILDDSNIECYKMLGAVTYFSHKCVSSLINFGFFDELLKRTETYKGDQFPRFGDYAVEEILYPSAASAFGPVSDIREPSSILIQQNIGRPNMLTHRYAVRYGEPIAINEITTETSIVHPTKTMCKIRQHHQKNRSLFL
jgi:hypothetical protein